MIVEYEILENTHCGLLQREVNEAIFNGWVPLGGIAFTDLSYAQAMVKYDTEKTHD